MTKYIVKNSKGIFLEKHKRYIGPVLREELATRFDSATAANLAAIEARLTGYEVVPVTENQSEEKAK